MKTSRRYLLLVLPVVSLSLAACGGPPAGDVAVVKTDQGDVPVTKAQFDRFFNYTLSQAQQKPVTEIVKPVPPAFTACVAAKKKAVPEDSQRKKSSDAEFKKTCDTEYEAARNGALQAVMNLRWIEAELGRRGIKVRKAELARELNNIITQQFQGQAGYKTFLTQSGLNEDDVKLNVIGGQTVGQAKIIAQLNADEAPPTDADVKRYFEQKKSTYVQPETRDLRLIKAKTEADAAAAKAAIEAGKSWTEVAKQYSTDAATKDQGGKVLATTADQQPPEFGSTVFKAKSGQLLGPIKTSLGFYVVKLQNINAEKQPVYSELKAQLQQTLQQETQQNAINRFIKLFQQRWAARTTCASGYDDLVTCGGDVGAAADASAEATKATPPPGSGLPKYAPRAPVETTPLDATQQQQQQAPPQTAAG